MPLRVGEPMRGAVRAEQTGLCSARASRRSVLTFRVRVAYIGAKFGSATTTSWPKASRHRATHSLSVEASTRIRARGRPPSTSANRWGSVRMRHSLNSPASREEADLAFLLVQVDANIVHGWPPPRAPVSACLSVGQCMPPRRAGGQPLHPIYPQSAALRRLVDREFYADAKRAGVDRGRRVLLRRGRAGSGPRLFGTRPGAFDVARVRLR